MNNHIWL